MPRPIGSLRKPPTPSRVITPRPETKPKLRAVGVTCGIGSMLVGARQAGFDIVGNIEWRRYYHKKDSEGRNTFLENFPGAFMVGDIVGLDDRQESTVFGCDLVMGHPECGNFSVLSGSLKTRFDKLKDPCDIPLFVNLVAQIQPRFFVMDDLPKSFGAFSMEEYARRLPDYDLFPEWVSNWGYGNIQKFRNRMFMLGAKKSEKWVFVPGEEDNSETVQDVIGDLPDPGSGFPNHDIIQYDSPADRFINMPKYGDRPTWREFSEYIKNLPDGQDFRYEREDGQIKVRIGSSKVRWGGTAPVISGGNPHFHPLRCDPLTLRERARIQGFPDTFVFYGTVLDDQGQWNHGPNLHMIKQTGKAMPIQFCRYVARQIRAKICGDEFTSSGQRILKANSDVDQAKQWYCQNIGYSDQDQACGQCWMAHRCSIRTTKYGIGDLSDSIQPVLLEVIRVTKSMAQDRPRAEKARSVDRLGPVAPIEVVDVVPKPGLTVTTTVERVCTKKGVIPSDYHCRCRFCTKVIGELIRPDGSYYSRLDRRGYYDKSESGEGGHIAKTPLHLARWAIQEYTKPRDWVLDPTAGAGTTLVESLVQGRNAAGVELEFRDIVLANVRKNCVGKVRAKVGLGDTRGIADFIRGMEFSLVQNNPPYFGDQSFPDPAKEGYGREFRDKEKTYLYDKTLPNLGLLKEGPEYWGWIRDVYQSCADRLKSGGRFVVGVKDQMRNRKPDQLHEKLAEVLEKIGLIHEGTAFLRHYPSTLHLNTYFKRYGVHPPYYQSILVFRKGK